MAAPDRGRRHRRGYVLPGGESPLLQQVAGIVGANLQILHHKPPMAFELRTVRDVSHRHLFGGMNRQFRRLGPLRAPPPRLSAIRRFLRCRSSRFQGIGLQLRPRRTALQPANLVLQPLNLLLLVADDLQQTPHEGGLLALGNLRQFRFEGWDEHDVQYSQFDYGKQGLPAVNEHLVFKEVRDNNIEINNLLNLINKRFEAFAWRTQYPNDFFALFAFAKSFDIQKLMDDLERRSQKLAEEAKINYDKRYKK